MELEIYATKGKLKETKRSPSLTLASFFLFGNLRLVDTVVGFFFILSFFVIILVSCARSQVLLINSALSRSILYF